MVRIVDGEIVHGDNTVPKAPPQSRPAPTSAPAVAPPTGFDFSAPPLRLAPNAAGPLGLQGLVIFGLHVEAVHLLMLAAAGLCWGAKGLFLGAVVYFFYVNNRAAAAAQSAPARQGQPQRGDPADIVRNFMAQGAKAPAAAPPDRWAGRGKAHTLNG